MIGWTDMAVFAAVWFGVPGLLAAVLGGRERARRRQERQEVRAAAAATRAAARLQAADWGRPLTPGEFAAWRALAGSLARDAAAAGRRRP